jgi:hypothetical protein
MCCIVLNVQGEIETSDDSRFDFPWFGTLHPANQRILIEPLIQRRFTWAEMQSPADGLEANSELWSEEAPE